MSIPTNIFDFEDAKQDLYDTYAEARPVLGVADVALGAKVAFPTTIYNISGDDGSGVAGLLYASGEFLPSAAPKKVAKYWDHTETLRYEKLADQDPAKPHAQCARGNSWTEGEVVWDGSVAGSIRNDALTGEEGDPVREVIKRRSHDASLTGEWASTGELWAGITSGRSMADMGPRAGRIHGWGTEEDYGGRRAAA